MTSLNSSPSTTTSLPQIQDQVSHIQIQQLTEEIQKLNDQNNQQVQQLQEQDRQLTEYKNQLNEQASPKWWQSIQAKMAYAVGLILTTATVMNQFIVTPIKETSDKRKDDIDRLEKQANTAEKVGNVQKYTSGQNHNGQLDLLSTLSINRVYYDFAARTVTSALILSETSKNQLKKSPVKTVALNIEFQPGQDSVEFWILDEQQHSKSQRLFKKEGKGNPGNMNERYFEISAGSFHNVDPASILEIRIESHGSKKHKNSESSFAIKSLILK
jgi:hypothetical protein